MALDNLTQLDRWKQTPFPPGYPDDARTFFSPIDDVHGCLKAVVASATKSLVVSMYGFDDPELAAIIRKKLEDEHLFVSLTLDSSQAGGVHEKVILEHEHYPASTVAVGRSERGAIMHMKMVVVDGLDVVTGSTNWSAGGEAKQDNQMTVHRSYAFAAECRARIDAIHANMLAKAK